MSDTQPREYHSELLEAAYDALAKSNYTEVVLKAEELMSVTEPSSRFYAEAKLVLAAKNYSVAEYAEMLSIATEAVEIAEKFNLLECKAQGLNLVGVAHKCLGNYDGALEYSQRSLEVFEQIGDTNGVARVTGNIGLVYDRLGLLDKSLEYHQKSYEVHAASANKLGQAITLGNIGIVYESLGLFEKSLEFNMKSLEIHEELGNTSSISLVIGNIGSLYWAIGEYDRALEYFRKSLIIKQELGEKSGIASALGNIGLVYGSLGNPELALEYYGKALATNEEIHDTSSIAFIKSSIASIYADMGNYELAVQQYLESLSLLEQLDERLGIVRALSSIGGIYASRANPHRDAVKALEYLQRSDELNKHVNSKIIESANCRVLSELFEDEGDSAKALQYHKQFHELWKELESEESKKLAKRTAYERQISEMQREQDVTERILHNILPRDIAVRIRRGDQLIVDHYEKVSVLFADIVGFTQLSQRVTPVQLVSVLNEIFNTFDSLAEKHGCEKIKTIGDCYMVVAGLPERCDDHAERLAALALDMIEAIKNIPVPSADSNVNMRIGIHSGSVVAGILGKNKYAYDLWGDAVNTASRMESHGEAGKIHVSDEFKRSVREGFSFVERGLIEIKGKGQLNTHYLMAGQG